MERGLQKVNQHSRLMEWGQRVEAEHRLPEGYQGYHKLPGNIRVVGCWAHAQRKGQNSV